MVFAERGIDFADVTPFFEDRGSIVREDTRQDYGEGRYNMLSACQGIVLNITFTPRAGRFHIISARTANRRERKIYAESKARP